MKSQKIYEMIGNMSVKQSKTYPIYCKDKDGNWVEAQARINYENRRIEIEDELINKGGVHNEKIQEFKKELF